MTTQEDMKYWLFEPDAAPEDPRWQDRSAWQVIVRERSQAFACVEAEKFILRVDSPGTHPGNETPSPVAGPRDVKLYRVQEISVDAAPSERVEQERGVVWSQRLERRNGRWMPDRMNGATDIKELTP